VFLLFVPKGVMLWFDFPVTVTVTDLPVESLSVEIIDRLE
jgi:hypothetical protein